MVSTVITTTIAAAYIGAVAVVGLIALSITGELAAPSERSTLRLLHRYLSVAVLPLLIVFAFIVIMEVLKVIS